MPSHQRNYYAAPDVPGVMVVLPQYHIHITEFIGTGSQGKLPLHPFVSLPRVSGSAEHIATPHDTDPRLGLVQLSFIYLPSMEKPYLDNNTICSRFELVNTFEVGDAHTTEGVVQVPFGIVHLFRRLDDNKSISTRSETQVSDEPEDEIGSVLAILNVPATINVPTLLQFLGPAQDALEQVRMIRQAEKDFVLVLLKFRDTLDAEEFFKMYNGVSFDLFDTPEPCELVYITGFTATATNIPPIPYPMSSALSPWPIVLEDKSVHALHPYRTGSGLRESAFELPTCPVCLDRLDSRLSGIVSVLCQHAFHCACLQRWSDSRCPVCRYSYAQHIKTPDTTQVSSHCSACEDTTNLWMWYVFIFSPQFNLWECWMWSVHTWSCSPTFRRDGSFVQLGG